jgi:putative DNA primase/helicase
MMDGTMPREMPASPADAPPPDAGGQMAAEERQAAIADLAALPKPEYAARRADEAVRLNMTRASLDKAVAAERARRRAEAEAEVRCRPDPAPGEVIWPPGIMARPDGLYADAGEDASPLWLAAPFEVMGEARNGASEGWGLYLRWRDRDGHLHVWPMPARLLMAEPGALEAELVSRGLRLSADPAARLRLRMALAEVRAGSRVRLAHRAGWQDAAGTAFLLPNGEVIGSTAEAVALDNPPEDAARLCATAGTLAGWQAEVAALAVGNPPGRCCCPWERRAAAST